MRTAEADLAALDDACRERPRLDEVPRPAQHRGQVALRGQGFRMSIAEVQRARGDVLFCERLGVVEVPSAQSRLYGMGTRHPHEGVLVSERGHCILEHLTCMLRG